MDVTAPTRHAPPPTPPYATFIPDRRPEFKPHNGIGQAKNAVIVKSNGGTFRYDMTIYRLDGGQYVPWIQITAGTRREDYPDLAPKPTPLRQLRFQLQHLDRCRADNMRFSEDTERRYRELAAEITRRENT